MKYLGRDKYDGYVSLSFYCPEKTTKRVEYTDGVDNWSKEYNDDFFSINLTNYEKTRKKYVIKIYEDEKLIYISKCVIPSAVTLVDDYINVNDFLIRSKSLEDAINEMKRR